jgi:hypothetical protein
MTVTKSKSYTAGHFEMLIDGHKTTTFLKSVDGGWAKANVVDDPSGGSSYAPCRVRDESAAFERATASPTVAPRSPWR